MLAAFITATLPDFTSRSGRVHLDGTPIDIKGANWFGFEGTGAVVDGLWHRPMNDCVMRQSPTPTCSPFIELQRLAS